jgi:hypothetical protein
MIRRMNLPPNGYQINRSKRLPVTVARFAKAWQAKKPQCQSFTNGHVERVKKISPPEGGPVQEEGLDKNPRSRYPLLVPENST